MPLSNTLVDLVVGDAELATLETAVVTAGLAEVLSGPGPYTVFAPIDSAFAAVDPALLNQLLTPPFQTHLQNVLAFHVAQGTVLSTDLMDGMTVEMLNGEVVTISITSSDEESSDEEEAASVTLSSPLTLGASVVAADLTASNGVAHKIGGSILVPSFVGRDLVDLLASDPNYSTLVSLVQMAGLVDTLRSAEALTVLAPDNTAFGSLPQDVLDGLTADSDALQAVLLYHVIDAVAASTSLSSGPVPTLNGASVQVSVSSGGVTIDGVPVVEPDLLAVNGIVHGISSVLIPNAPAPAPTSPYGPTTWSAQQKVGAYASSASTVAHMLTGVLALFGSVALAAATMF